MIRSQRTGKVEAFYFHNTDVSEDDEFEILAWNFLPVNPKCGVDQVTIFND